MYLRLIWETGEWDPVAASWATDDEARWSVGSEESEGSEDDGEEEEEEEEGKEDGTAQKGKFIRREVELVDGTREVGFWIEEREARVRVEVRGRPW